MPAVAALIAPEVPSPIKIPVMLVEIVIAGVVVSVATVPPKPLADTTLAVVTVPPPPAGAVLCQPHWWDAIGQSAAVCDQCLASGDAEPVIAAERAPQWLAAFRVRRLADA